MQEKILKNEFRKCNYNIGGDAADILPNITRKVRCHILDAAKGQYGNFATLYTSFASRRYIDCR